MYKVRIVNDPEECKFIWKSIYPAKNIFDLWEIRECFANQYNHEKCFITVEENKKIIGLLPLVLSNETQTYVFYPGEAWEKKTWLEQNIIIAPNTNVLDLLLKSIPGKAYLRYIAQPAHEIKNFKVEVDETGYLFIPGEYNYSVKNYLADFSTKSRKRLVELINTFQDMGAHIRLNCKSDIEKMFKMNIERFGEKSYFNSQLFLDSFRSLLNYLYDNRILRILTVVIDNKEAAIDVGSIWQSGYTLLAGGTNPGYPGIAKYINLTHIEWACKEQVEYVDFLCGDFGWKNMFHLKQRNLYKICIE